MGKSHQTWRLEYVLIVIQHDQPKSCCWDFVHQICCICVLNYAFWGWICLWNVYIHIIIYIYTYRYTEFVMLYQYSAIIAIKNSKIEDIWGYNWDNSWNFRYCPPVFWAWQVVLMWSRCVSPPFSSHLRPWNRRPMCRNGAWQFLL